MMGEVAIEDHKSCVLSAHFPTAFETTAHLFCLHRTQWENPEN